MIEESLRSWLALKQVQGVGNIVAKRLIEALGTPEAVFSASEEALWAIDGVSENIAKNILTFNAFDEVCREMEKIDQAGVTVLVLTDPSYPPLLSKIDDPPLMLYVKGTLLEQDRYSVAIVGTRQMTTYGRSVAERLGSGLAQAGITLVSGFARGIDAVAHQSALRAQGRTIAVLGCGVDRIYPPEHQQLYDQIVERGAILSEFAMGVHPEPFYFPQRNRIISGLSLGSVVVEASQKSGALITARCALEQGREVFAVPGSIFSETSCGTHRLLQSGAKLVERVQDILDELAPQMEPGSTASSVSPLPVPPSSSLPQLPELLGEEGILYQLLSLEPKHIDRLIEESSLEPALVSHRLLEMELKGVVRQHVGQRYTTS